MPQPFMLWFLLTFLSYLFSIALASIHNLGYIQSCRIYIQTLTNAILSLWNIFFQLCHYFLSFHQRSTKTESPLRNCSYLKPTFPILSLFRMLKLEHLIIPITVFINIRTLYFYFIIYFYFIFYLIFILYYIIFYIGV